MLFSLVKDSAYYHNPKKNPIDSPFPLVKSEGLGIIAISAKMLDTTWKVSSSRTPDAEEVSSTRETFLPLVF